MLCKLYVQQYQIVTGSQLSPVPSTTNGQTLLCSEILPARKATLEAAVDTQRLYTAADATRVFSVLPGRTHAPPLSLKTESIIHVMSIADRVLAKQHCLCEPDTSLRAPERATCYQQSDTFISSLLQFICIHRVRV